MPDTFSTFRENGIVGGKEEGRELIQADEEIVGECGGMSMFKKDRLKF